MLFSIFLRSLSPKKLERFVRKRGFLLAIRNRKGKSTYIYMYRRYFAIIAYQDDTPASAPMEVTLITGIKNLNSFLQQDLKNGE